MKAVAVVLASGSGERFGSMDLPKHLTPICDIPIVCWTINTILKSELFSALVVVSSSNNFLATNNCIKEYFTGNKTPILFAKGSTERSESFNLGFDVLLDQDLVNQNSIVSLFDANRPFVSIAQIAKLHDIVQDNECACPARPVVNGVALSSGGKIQSVPDKSQFVEFVTPEFLNLGAFRCELKNFLRGHNCFVEFALSFGFFPITIESTKLNTKLTYPEDKSYMEGLVESNNLNLPVNC